MLKNIGFAILFIIVLLVLFDLGLGFIGNMILGKQSAMMDSASSSTGFYSDLPANLSKQYSGPEGPFTISTNQYGMRMGKVKVENASQATRIAILGDAAALAYGLENEQGFSSRLQNVLDEEDPIYQVLNFSGIPYSSLQALRRYERLVHNFKPDILIIAVGRFDAYETRLSDTEYFDLLQEHFLDTKEPSWLAWFSRFSSAAYWFHQNLWQKKHNRFQQSLALLQKRNEWRERVSEAQFINNLESMLKHQEGQGSRSILLNLNLLNYHRHKALQTSARTHDAPLLDIRAFFDTLGGRNERRLALQMNLDLTDLAPQKRSPSKLLFRAHTGRALDHPLYLLLNHPNQQSKEAQAIPLNDEGQKGDERGGDSVWSLELEMEVEEPFVFAFLEGTPSENDVEYKNKPQREWKNGLIQYRFVPPGYSGAFQWRSPVYRLGKSAFSHLVLSGDPALPNALAHQAIATRLAALIHTLNNQNHQMMTKISSN